MSISNIIDPQTKKIYPSLLNGQGGAVDSVNVKTGLVNVGTGVDPIIGLNVSNSGELLVGNGTANEAIPLPLGTAGQVLKVNVGATDVEWANESVPTAFTAQGQILYGGVGPAFNPADLAIGTAGQVLKVNAGATAPEWGNEAGGNQDLAQVLAVGADANNVPITGLGNLSFGTGTTITGPAGAKLDIVSDAGQNIDISSGNGLGIISTAEIELNSGADITLKCDAVGALLRLLVNGQTGILPVAPQAGAFPANVNAQLAVNINGIDYYIPLMTVASPQ